MALTIGLAALVVVLVVVGLRAAAGPGPSDEAIEVPPWAGRVAPTGPSSVPSTVAPGSPSNSTPGTGGQGTTIPRVDTETLRVEVVDRDGRFRIVVPRTWANLPEPVPDQNQWVPLVQLPDGELVSSRLTFAVRWTSSGGCVLDRCAADVVNRMKGTYPGVTPTTTPATVGGLPAVRIEATLGDERVVAWVVVKGDRYWVPQLRGPAEGFDPVLAVVNGVVASMSFD